MNEKIQMMQKLRQHGIQTILTRPEDLSINTAGTIGYTVKEDELGAPGKEDIFQFVMPEIARPEQTITLYGFTTNEKDSAAAVNMRFFDVAGNKVQTVVPSFCCGLFPRV